MDFRYLIFQYDVYYPSGGINDLRGTFNDIEDVRSFIENNKSNYDNYHIYDRISGEQIHDLWSDELPQPAVISTVCENPHCNDGVTLELYGEKWYCHVCRDRQTDL